MTIKATMSSYSQKCAEERSIWTTLGMILTLFSFYGSPMIGVTLAVILLMTPLYPLILLYFLWIYLDRHTPHQGGRKIKWIRSLGMFHHFRKYFPHVLVKTADLPPTENYILVATPHGFLATGPFAHCANDNEEFQSLFPGLSSVGHTLNINFYFPFSREFVMGLGIVSASKEALIHQLTRGKGNASMLIAGGAAEATLSSPGTYRSLLKNRKGFVKMALVTGAHLVPIYVFGETNLFNTKIFPKGSILFKIQEAVRKFTGVALILATGRGLTENSFGILPFAKPVYTVVGKPIQVEKNENPTREEIESLHARFLQELTDLFETHKHKYLPNPESAFLSIE